MLNNTNTIGYKLNLDDFNNSRDYLQSQLEFCYHELDIYNQLRVVENVVKLMRESLKITEDQKASCIQCNAKLIDKLQNIEGIYSHLIAHILDKFIVVQSPKNLMIIGTLGIFEISSLIAQIYIASLDPRNSLKFNF